MAARFHCTITNKANDKDDWRTADAPINEFIHKMMLRGHQVGPKDGTGIIAATFKPKTHLKQENLESVTGLILDIDGKFRKTGDTIPAGTVLSDDGKYYYEVVPPDWLLSKLSFCGFAHTSHSHGPALPKYRVILPFAEPIAPSEFMRLWFWIYEKVERKADPSCKNPDRMFFFPRCTKDAQDAGWPWVRALYGPPLSLSMVPADFQIPDEFRYELERPQKKQGMHFAPPQTNFRPTDAHKLLETLLELPIYGWAVEDAEMVSRETWRGLATNIAAAVLEDETAHEAGAKAFHEISECDDARYNRGVTEKTFKDALRSAQAPGPMTYKNMKLNGAPMELDEGESKSPVAHARKILSAKEGPQRPKDLAPASSLTTGAEYVEAPAIAVVAAATAPDAVIQLPADPTETAPEAEEEPPAAPESLTIKTYQQTNILLDVHRNAYILKETNLFNGEITWALDKPIKEEALNKMLVSMGLPRKQLDEWKQYIEYFHFRRCVYTTNQLLVTAGPSVIFNTYKPTKMNPVPGNWDNIRALFLHLVGNDPDALEYFLDWCAAPLQKIRKQESPQDGHYKNGSAVVLRGDPGAGKGTAMEILMLCYGMTNCVTLGQEDLDGKFHSNLLDKLFVVGNEIMSSSNRSAQTANKLKSWVTDPRIPCEGKFSDAMEAENNFNIVFTSNDERPIIIEKGDRRYSVFQSTAVPKHIIGPVRADLIQGQAQVAAFYDAMLSRQVKIKYGDLYETVARTQVQQASAPTSERFAAAIVEDGYLSVAASWVSAARSGEVREPVVSFNSEFFVLADTLMLVYRHYCQGIGAHPQHVRALSLALQQAMPAVEPSFRITLGGVQRRAWRGLKLDSPQASVLPMPKTVTDGVTASAPETISENTSDMVFGDTPKGP